MLGRRSVLRLCALAAAAAALTLAFASSAFAGPSDPILSFTDLRAALAASPTHHLTGYMKTVVDSSQEVTTIPLTVLSVPQTGGVNDDLIMFEATGPLIAKYGGIVAGMSGSPVYLDDGHLIGAVSYGDYFTLGGTGLATPIEAMTQIQTSYSAAAVPLKTPVITSNGLFNQVIVAPDPQNFAGAAKAGAFVAKPLASVFIGGMSPSSAGYKALAKHLASRGVSVVAVNSQLAADADDAGAFETTFTAGSSIAALVSRGDMWIGDIGTVTYADGDDVLAFGHPAYWTGATSYYMANASIEGIWPSAYEPYKVGDPGKIRGTITQDRNAGILGKLDRFADETIITSHAIDKDSGRETTSEVRIPRRLLASGFADGSLAGWAAYMAGSRLYDQRMQPGSAITTTTITLMDGTTTRTVVLANNSSSSSDIASAVSYAAQTAVSTLQSVLQYGIEKPQILSIDLTGEYSTQRTDAQIVRVDAPNGLHVGSNLIRVSTLEFGVAATQTAETTLVIPAGTPLGGTITAQAASEVANDSMSMGDVGGATFSRKTIAGLVDQLNATVPDTAIQVTYQPGGSSGSASDFFGDGESVDDPSTSLSTITSQFLSPWPVSGQARSYVTTIFSMLLPSQVNYGGFADGLVGVVSGPSTATVVSVYAKTAGSSAETLVGTTVATPFEGELMFEMPLFQSYTRNTTFRIHVDATDSSTAADSSITLGVHAIVRLSSSATRIRPGKSVKLSVSVYPNTAAGGTVVFEQQVGKTWRKVASRTLATSGSYAKASYTWKPGKGNRKVRARYLGGTYNTATASSTKTIAVK